MDKASTSIATSLSSPSSSHDPGDKYSQSASMAQLELNLGRTAMYSGMSDSKMDDEDSDSDELFYNACWTTLDPAKTGLVTLTGFRSALSKIEVYLSEDMIEKVWLQLSKGRSTIERKDWIQFVNEEQSSYLEDAHRELCLAMDPKSIRNSVINEQTCMKRDSIQLADIEAEYAAQLEELRQKEVARINRGFTGRKLYRPSDEQNWQAHEINDLTSELTTELRKMKEAERRYSVQQSDWLETAGENLSKPNSGNMQADRSLSVELIVDDGILEGMKQTLWNDGLSSPSQQSPSVINMPAKYEEPDLPSLNLEMSYSVQQHLSGPGSKDFSTSKRLFYAKCYEQAVKSGETILWRHSRLFVIGPSHGKSAFLNNLSGRAQSGPLEVQRRKSILGGDFPDAIQVSNCEVDDTGEQPKFQRVNFASKPSQLKKYLTRLVIRGLLRKSIEIQDLDEEKSTVGDLKTIGGMIDWSELKKYRDEYARNVTTRSKSQSCGDLPTPSGLPKSKQAANRMSSLSVHEVRPIPQSDLEFATSLADIVEQPSFDQALMSNKNTKTPNLDALDLKSDTIRFSVFEFNADKRARQLHPHVVSRLGVYIFVFSMVDVLDVARVDEVMERLHYWLDTIALFAFHAPIILLGTHLDIISAVARHEHINQLLVSRFKSHCAWKFVQFNEMDKLHFFPIDNMNAEKRIANITRKLISVIEGDVYEHRMPIVWLEALDKIMSSHTSVMDIRTLTPWSKTAFDGFVDLFHELGIIFHTREDPQFSTNVQKTFQLLYYLQRPPERSGLPGVERYRTTGKAGAKFWNGLAQLIYEGDHLDMSYVARMARSLKLVTPVARKIFMSKRYIVAGCLPKFRDAIAVVKGKLLQRCYVQSFDFGLSTVPQTIENEDVAGNSSKPKQSDENMHPNLYHESFFPTVITKIYSMFPKSAIMTRHECAFALKSKRQFLIDERGLARTKTIRIFFDPPSPSKPDMAWLVAVQDIIMKTAEVDFSGKLKWKTLQQDVA